MRNPEGSSVLDKMIIKDKKKKCKNCVKIINSNMLGYKVNEDMWKRKKFCSPKCHYTYIKGKLRSDGRLKKKCEFCKKVFKTYNKNQLFCSINCVSLYKRKKKEKKCLKCGKKHINKKFCSKECQYKYMLSDNIKKKCVNCKKIYTIYFYRHKISKFCSYKCYWNYMSKYYVKCKSSNWQGGISKEPYDFSFDKLLKLSVANMNKWRCQICFEKKNKGHIHHIHYNKKDSRLETLVFLDKNCHMKTNGNRDYWFAYFCKLKNIEPYEVFR